MGRARKSRPEGRYFHGNHSRRSPKKTSNTFSSEDAQIVSFVREMMHEHRVSETTFQAIYGRLGESGLVELTATIGYYAMLACTLNTFDIATSTRQTISRLSVNAKRFRHSTRLPIA